MRAAKFWEFIEGNPWFFQLITWEESCFVPELGHATTKMGVKLAQEIPKEIRWIAFRPFRKAILRRKTVDTASPLGEERFTEKHLIEETNIFVVFWHLPEARAFSQLTSVTGGTTVGATMDAIRAARQGAIVDAIVRIVNQRSRALTPGFRRRGFGPSEWSKYYEVYLVSGMK